MSINISYLITQSMMATKAYSEGEDGMNAESELSRVAYISEFGVNDLSITRELIMQYIDAGILFPEEICHAEQLLRQICVETDIS